jgi:hypothetical protein
MDPKGKIKHKTSQDNNNITRISTITPKKTTEHYRQITNPQATFNRISTFMARHLNPNHNMHPTGRTSNGHNNNNNPNSNRDNNHSKVITRINPGTNRTRSATSAKVHTNTTSVLASHRETSVADYLHNQQQQPCK